MEHKSVDFAEFKAEGSEGLVEAFVSVFDNVDLGNEVVRFGAFKNSLERKLPKIAMSHKWDEAIGVTLQAVEMPAGDPRLTARLQPYGGLYVKGRITQKTVRGREAFGLLQDGIIDEFSIGYSVTKDRFDEKGVRELLELNLVEWSPVMVGMNPDTELVSLKSDVPATFCYQCESVQDAFSALAARTKSLDALKRKEGRVISAANRTRISTVLATMRSIADEIDQLLSNSDHKPSGAELAPPLEGPKSVSQEEINRVLAETIQLFQRNGITCPI